MIAGWTAGAAIFIAQRRDLGRNWRFGAALTAIFAVSAVIVLAAAT